jgi:hypothetical protein
VAVSEDLLASLVAIRDTANEARMSLLLLRQAAQAIVSEDVSESWWWPVEPEADRMDPARNDAATV